MSRDKQIEEMAKVINEMDERNAHYYDKYMQECEAFADADAIAEELYNAGYRKIYDDNQRQCTCYALGCQMAESLKSEVAREIFEEIEKLIVRRMIPDATLLDDRLITDIAELKKKYESEKDK